jgi:hypothetical protein
MWEALQYDIFLSSENAQETAMLKIIIGGHGRKKGDVFVPIGLFTPQVAGCDVLSNTYWDYPPKTHTARASEWQGDSLGEGKMPFYSTG